MRGIDSIKDAMAFSFQDLNEATYDRTFGGPLIRWHLTTTTLRLIELASINTV